MNIRNYTMFGRPTRVLPFAPNWSSLVNESFEWKTDVLRAHDGSEQRRALRVEPRRSFDYNTLLAGRTTTLFENLMFNWLHRHFAMPVWTEIGRLTTAALAGASTLNLVTDTLGFRADDFGIAYLDPFNYEVFEIQSVSANSVATKAGLENTWPEGTRVFPLLVGHLATSVTETRHTSRVAEAVFSLSSTPDIGYSNIVPASPSVMFDGVEVVTARANWSGTIGNDFSREFEIADTGVGTIGYFDREKYTAITRSFPWFLKTRQQIVDFRSLMGRLCGQAKTVWMPTHHEDFIVSASNAADRSVLYVSGTDFHTLVGANIDRGCVGVTHGDGTVEYRKITQTTPKYSSNYTTLQLNSALNSTVGVADNSRVQLLLKWRLATDKIVIPWQTDGVATPQTAFRTVKS